MKINKLLIGKKKGQEDKPFERRKVNEKLLVSRTFPFNKANVSKPGKKGQEEMVGFVLIILLVVIIGLVFLGIAIRKSPNIEEQSSNRIDSFLKSIRYYTTECEIPSGNYRTIEQLINDCYENEQCINNKLACEVLEDTLKEIMQSSFLVSNNSYTLYYKLEVKTEESGKQPINIVRPIIAPKSIDECKGIKMSNSNAISTQSKDVKVRIKLEVCYKTLEY